MLEHWKEQNKYCKGMRLDIESSALNRVTKGEHYKSFTIYIYIRTHIHGCEFSTINAGSKGLFSSLC